jgi:hypothetical protein
MVAADRFAAYILLKFGKGDARRLVAGVAYDYARDGSVSTKKKNPFADPHGLPMQRFYKVLCLPYGADAKLFEQVVSDAHLPAERAEGCEDEYTQVKRAMKS